MAHHIIVGKQTANLRSEYGFGYLTILFLVLAMSVVLGIATENLNTSLKREKEKDWIFIGKQYQQAISNYYHQSPNGFKTLPESIEMLLSDTRFIKNKHHLRKAFLDPMTSQPWQVIRNNQNKLIGVQSTSNQVLLMSPKQLSVLFGKKITAKIAKHSDLKFEYVPNIDDQNTTSQP